MLLERNTIWTNSEEKKKRPKSLGKKYKLVKFKRKRLKALIFTLQMRRQKACRIFSNIKSTAIKGRKINNHLCPGREGKKPKDWSSIRYKIKLMHVTSSDLQLGLHQVFRDKHTNQNLL